MLLAIPFSIPVIVVVVVDAATAAAGRLAATKEEPRFILDDIVVVVTSIIELTSTNGTNFIVVVVVAVFIPNLDDGVGAKAPTTPVQHIITETVNIRQNIPIVVVMIFSNDEI